MKSTMKTIGIGLVIGPVVFVVAFESIGVAYFGLGRYSSQVLTDALAFGTVLGLVFGPAVALRRPARWKAAALAATLVAIPYLVLQYYLTAQGGVHSSIQDAITSTLNGLSYLMLSTVLATIMVLQTSSYILRLICVDHPARPPRPRIPSEERVLKL